MSRASSAPAAKRSASAESTKAGKATTKLVKAGSKKTRPAAAPVVEKDGWLQRLKRLRLSFKRKGLNIQVLIEDPAKHIAEIKRESAVADVSEAATLSAALRGVLDRHPTSRSVLVHLALLEKAMSRHGLKALVDQLRDLRAQLVDALADQRVHVLAELGTPSLFRPSRCALRRCFELVPVLPGLGRTSPAMLVILLVTPPSFSSAALWVFFCSDTPSFTRASNTLPPSACALREGAHAGEPDLLGRILHLPGECAVEQAAADAPSCRPSA
jgi:hypothetical protein